MNTLVRNRVHAGGWSRPTGLIVLVGGVLLGLLTACAASPESPASPPFVTAGDQKVRLLRQMEQQIDIRLDEARPVFAEIRDATEKELATLSTPIRLQVIDAVLSKYGEADEEQFRARIDEIVDRSRQRGQELIDQVSRQLREDAYRLAGTDVEAVAEFATGYDDLDNMVLAADDRLATLAALPGLDDLGYLRRGEAVRLPRATKVDREGAGRLSLFISPPMKDRVLADQESQAVVVTFQPPAGAEPVGPTRLIQAVRHRILRGGVPVQDLGWQLDPNTPGGDGIIPLDGTVAAPGYLVSRIAYPGIDNNAPAFDQWRDHVFEIAFETAAQRTDTGEFLSGVSWRLRWIATHGGKLLVEACPPPVPRTDDYVILERLVR